MKWTLCFGPNLLLSFSHSVAIPSLNWISWLVSILLVAASLFLAPNNILFVGNISLWTDSELYPVLSLSWKELKIYLRNFFFLLGRVMSVVASSATYISTEFNMSEIFVVMTDQIKHNFRNVQFKHTFLPVLGEFLFYAATQEENEDKLLPNWEPTGDTLNEFGLWDIFYWKFFFVKFSPEISFSANLQQQRTNQIFEQWFQAMLWKFR